MLPVDNKGFFDWDSLEASLKESDDRLNATLLNLFDNSVSNQNKIIYGKFLKEEKSSSANEGQKEK